jgi:hypothetical protein
MQHRQLSGIGVCAQSTAYLEAVNVRQIDVEYHEVRL